MPNTTGMLPNRAVCMRVQVLSCWQACTFMKHSFESGPEAEEATFIASQGRPGWKGASAIKSLAAVMQAYRQVGYLCSTLVSELACSHTQLTAESKTPTHTYTCSTASYPATPAKCGHHAMQMYACALLACQAVLGRPTPAPTCQTKQF